MSSGSFRKSPERVAARARSGLVCGSRVGVLTAGVIVVFLGAAAPASAHLRSGTVAVDYRASVLRPRTAAYSAQIFQSDRALSLTVSPGHTVVLLGYLGEPVFRLDAGGLWVNATSPTAAALRLVKRQSRCLVVNASVGTSARTTLGDLARLPRSGPPAGSAPRAVDRSVARGRARVSS